MLNSQSADQIYPLGSNKETQTSNPAGLIVNGTYIEYGEPGFFYSQSYIQGLQISLMKCGKYVDNKKCVSKRVHWTMKSV